MITGTSAGVGGDDVAARAAAQAQIDDRRDELMLLAALEPFVGGLGGHDREAVHLEELHERPADRQIVFDDEHEAGGVLGP